jgi:hypothetical protein
MLAPAVSSSGHRGGLYASVPSRFHGLVRWKPLGRSLADRRNARLDPPASMYHGGGARVLPCRSWSSAAADRQSAHARGG